MKRLVHALHVFLLLQLFGALLLFSRWRVNIPQISAACQMPYYTARPYEHTQQTLLA